MQINIAIMKYAALWIALTLALSSQAFAILRPRYPVRPSPPFRGEIIVIGDESIQTAPASPTVAARK
jgi:hypothetical protein